MWQVSVFIVGWVAVCGILPYQSLDTPEGTLERFAAAIERDDQEAIDALLARPHRLLKCQESRQGSMDLFPDGSTGHYRIGRAELVKLLRSAAADKPTLDDLIHSRGTFQLPAHSVLTMLNNPALTDAQRSALFQGVGLRLGSYAIVSFTTGTWSVRVERGQVAFQYAEIPH